MMDNLLAPVCVPDRQNEQHERVQFRQNLSAVLIANPQMSIGLGLCDGDAMMDGCCLAGGKPTSLHTWFEAATRKF